MQNVVGDLFDGGGHGVSGVDGADDCGPTLVAAVILNADGFNVGNSDEVLPRLLCKSADVKLLAKITDRITTEVEGINRVLYDITPKPTGTIEWE